MQACQDVCLAMLRAKRTVDNLNSSSMDSNHYTTTLPLLQQHHHEFQTASSMLIYGDLWSPRFDPQHTQLITCFAKLSASLCKRINALIISSPPLSNQGLVCSKETLEFSNLWPMLLMSCEVFQICGQQWPEPTNPADYQLIRDALYHLLNFLLNITRGGSDAFFSVIQMNDPETVIKNTYSVLVVPLVYFHSISLWPVSSIESEVAELPSDFISLLCCLVVEQYGLVSADMHKPLSGIQMNLTPATLQLTPSIIKRVCSLGESVTLIVSNTTELDRAMQGFTSPAVIQLLASFLMCAEQKTSNNADLNIMTMVVLIAVIDGLSISDHNTGQDSSLEAFLQNCGGQGKHLLPNYIPKTPVVDTVLLRFLLSRTRDDVLFLGLRCQLFVTLMAGWDPDASMGISIPPFPASSAAQRDVLLYWACHHCAAGTLRKIKHEQKQSHRTAETAQIRLASTCSSTPKAVILDPVCMPILESIWACVSPTCGGKFIPADLVQDTRILLFL